MKKILLPTVLALITGLTVFTACNDDDDGYSLDNYWTGMATVVAPETTQPFMVGNETFSLTLDNGQTLWPAAINTYLYGYSIKNAGRVVANFTLLSGEKDGYSHYIRLNSLRNVLTKQIDTLSVSTPENSVLRGTAPINMADVWIGDGYVNIIFDYLGSPYTTHYINLIVNELSTTANPENGLWTLQFVHDANKDTGRYPFRGIVSFKIPDNLQTDVNKIKISAKDYDGETESVVINYKPMMSQDAPASIDKLTSEMYLN